MKKYLLAIAATSILASCQNNSSEADAQHTIDSLNNEMAKRALVDSMNQVRINDSLRAVEEMSVSSSGVTSGSGSHKSYSSTTTTNNYYSENPQTNSATTTTTTTTTQKKGWSAKAKGAVIGAGAGAVTGAMVDKKKGRGAIIGGVAGAAAGLGAGAIIDSKQKKEGQ